MIRPITHPFVDILLAGLPTPAPRPTLTARELSLCVELLGKGRTLAQAIDLIQAQRPTLPFSADAGTPAPYVLYVRHPNRSIEILRFPTRRARALVCITLGSLPVDLRLEDPAVAS